MKASIFCARLALSLLTIALVAAAASAQDRQLNDDLQSSFKKFDLVRTSALRTNGRTKTLALRADDKDFVLAVEPNDLRSPRYRAEDTNMIGVTRLESPAVKTYKGKIAGVETSKVRLTIDGEDVEGFFEGPSGRLFIEPARKYSNYARHGDAVVYRAEDSKKDNSFFCDADIPTKIEMGREMAGAGRAESMMVMRVLELATEADLEWVNTLGGPAQANAEIMSILNMIEGTYNNEINISIRVVYQHTWSTSDPFNGADMNGMLTAFVNYWNANNGSIARDTAHLFSGKSAAQGRGYAYIGVVCRSPAFSYGMSGYIGWAPGKFLVPAHEIAHNLGADHVDAAQNCANSLMNPTLTGATPLSFCAFSRSAIDAYVSANNSCLSEVSTGVAPFDFDGDSRSDISVFRPSNGVWYLNRSTSGFTAFRYGILGDLAVAADYDGDGKSDPAVYRSGVWYRLKSATNTTDVVSFGLPGDLPSPADFDGDNKADVGVFRPSTGIWYSLSSGNGAFSSVRFGVSGDVPMAGDYDGDGRDDINLFRPSNGTWYRLNSSNGSAYAINFGLNGDKPVAGDFDGDDRSDIAVWRPSNGVWYVLRSATGAFSATAFGLANDMPAAADFDGDGRTDISVFRPSNGVWYRLDSSDGAFAAVAFGQSGDAPVPSYYLQ